MAIEDMLDESGSAMDKARKGRMAPEHEADEQKEMGDMGKLRQLLTDAMAILDSFDKQHEQY